MTQAALATIAKSGLPVSVQTFLADVTEKKRPADPDALLKMLKEAMASAPPRPRRERVHDAENGFNSDLEKKLAKIYLDVAKRIPEIAKKTSIDREDDTYLAEGVLDHNKDQQEYVDDWRMEIAALRKSLSDPDADIGRAHKGLQLRRKSLAHGAVAACKLLTLECVQPMPGDDSLARGISEFAKSHIARFEIAKAQMELHKLGAKMDRVQKLIEKRREQAEDSLPVLADVAKRTQEGRTSYAATGVTLLVKREFQRTQERMDVILAKAESLQAEFAKTKARMVSIAEAGDESAELADFHFDEFIAWAEAG